VKSETAAQAEKDKQTPDANPESEKVKVVKEKRDKSRKSRFQDDGEEPLEETNESQTSVQKQRNPKRSSSQKQSE
jgi:hypothetical protein